MASRAIKPRPSGPGLHNSNAGSFSYHTTLATKKKMDQMDKFEELRRQLRESNQRQRELEDNADRDRKRADKADEQRLKAEEVAQKATKTAEELAKAAEESAKAAEEAKRLLDLEVRLTTLGEYLDLCQEKLYNKFSVETNIKPTTKDCTNTEKKWCPDRLLPWTDFLERQKEILGKVHTAFGEERVFDKASELNGLTKALRKRLANEGDVVLAQHLAIQYPVETIVSKIADRPSAKAALEIVSRIVFENHLPLNDANNEEKQGSGDDAPGGNNEAGGNQKGNRKPKPKPKGKKPKSRPDQVAVLSSDINPDNPEDRAVAFVAEYKAPHKLTAAHLRLGVREMDIGTDVVARLTSPITARTDDHFQYVSDRLVAAAITQTYHYMMESGLEYSYLTTTEAFVFLKIDWNNPGNLFFHLAEPKAEVAEHGPNGRYCTAVSQVLAFALLALTTRQKSQDARKDATKDLKTWKMNWEMMEEIIAKEVDATPKPDSKPASPSGHTPPSARVYRGVDRSPQAVSNVGQRRSARLIELEERRCQDEADKDTGGRAPDQDDEDDNENGGGNGNGNGQPRATDEATNQAEAPASNQSRKTKTRSTGASQAATPRPRRRPYCTQQCLLGLVCGFSLDPRCPNVELHRGTSDGCRHPVDHKTWQRLLAEQLDRTLDDGIKPLWKHGARGVLFAVTLLEHGYTFVAKATTTESVKHLKHEATMYSKLRTLQGSGIPVFLGSVKLKWPYRYDFGVQLFHMIFLSWGGESILDKKDKLGLDQAALDCQLLPLVESVHNLGIVHMDVRGPNILWCEETGRVMLIDFERATTIASRRKSPHPLHAQVVQRYIHEDLGNARIALGPPPVPRRR